ncbi:hypothetical protein BGZ49_009292 [Haplosporangium sp. Z 27]|nr:hypothetical protein BGZ49_009292 [Haplosporangium sp. Z 27]
MPATPPFEARRGSLRSRNTTSTTGTQSTSSKPGTNAQTRAQLHSQQDSQQSRSIGGSASTLSPNSNSSRTGRPKKEAISILIDDNEKSKKSRGKTAKTRESSAEPSTPSTPGFIAMDQVEEAHSSKLSIKDTQMDVDKGDSGTQFSTRPSGQRHSTRQSTSISKEIHQSSRNNGGSTSSSGNSETQAPKKDRAQLSQLNQDRRTEDASSGSEDNDGDEGSDDDHQERESTKGKKQKATAVPSKRRLRSSKRIPSVVAHLAVDGDGLTIDQILEEYSEEQQVLRANAGAAEALTRLFRQGIQDSESLHPDMIDAQDYELIRHTFGEVEDLNLNLTGTMTAPDESSVEDDDLTRDLKRKHRKAKRTLLDISAEYKAVKRSMTIKMSAQLDKEEAQIKAGTHPDLLAELEAIEERRQARIKIVQAQKDYLKKMWDINFQAVCKAANDQYHAGQIAARKNIKDMVQYRINRIKQEFTQDKKISSRSSRRLIYINAVGADGYDSCGESCSSYDSYSSSGSECSDCDICRPPRHLQIPQLRVPKGLHRREVALDLSFLFPESISSSSHHQPLDDFSSSRDHSARARQYSSDGEDPSHRQRNGRNQQYTIDHLNDERRRKRRVLDRELQNRAAYKYHSASEKGNRAGDHDMDIDQDQEFEYLERGTPTIKLSEGSSSRPHSPTQPKGASQPSSRSLTKDYRPRFLPGFGPDGMESTKRYTESLMDPRVASRYTAVDRYNRPLSRSKSGVADTLKTSQTDPPRPYSMLEREHIGMQGTRITREPYSPERNIDQYNHHYSQQYRRRHEIQDTALSPKNYRDRPEYRSSREAHRNAAFTPMDDLYMYENDQKSRLNAPTPTQAPYPMDRAGYSNRRGRPLKSSQILLSWGEPTPHQGHGSDIGRLPPVHLSTSPSTAQKYEGRRSPVATNGASPRTSSITRYDTSRSIEELYSEHRNSSLGLKPSHSHRRMDGPIRERHGEMYSTSPRSTSGSIPSPPFTTKTLRSPSSHHSRSLHLSPQIQRPPISPEQIRMSGFSPSMAYHSQQQYQLQQQQRLAMQRVQSRDPPERPAPIIIDLSSPPTSPKQEPAKISSMAAPATPAVSLGNTAAETPAIATTTSPVTTSVTTTESPLRPVNGHENGVTAGVGEQSLAQENARVTSVNGISSNGINTAAEGSAETLERSTTSLDDNQVKTMPTKDKPDLLQKNENFVAK